MPPAITESGSLSNPNLGIIQDVGGNVQLGNNQYISQDFHSLIIAIGEVLKRPQLPPDNRLQLELWIKELNHPNATQISTKILHDFMLLKSKLDNVENSYHDKLKIWLNRHNQREIFSTQLKAFCKKGDQISPFIFCISGQAEEDGLADAAEMLELYYLDDLMRINHPDYFWRRTVADTLMLANKEQAEDAFDSILRDALDMNVFAERTDFFEVLRTKHHQQHLIIRCRVRTWKNEGLQRFLNKWTQAFERHPLYPFVLLLEFPDAEYSALAGFLEADFHGCSISLLPPLGQIEAKDLTDFYDRPLKLPGYSRFDDIFDRNSLTSTDTPLCYQLAINKLKLKAR